MAYTSLSTTRTQGVSGKSEQPA